MFRKYAESKAKWMPDVLDKLSLDPFSLNIIVGPRQLGKFTALLLLVSRLLSYAKHDAGDNVIPPAEGY
ncbi:MAG: hypothetical protein QXV84_04290 [Conexivisphaerales archaeon]